MGSSATVTPGNFALGPCRVTFGGVDLGATKGGVTVSKKYKLADMTADQFGSSPIDSVVSGIEFTVKVPLAEVMSKENWKVAFPHAKLVTSGGNKMMYFDMQMGDSLLAHAQALVIHPLSKADADLSGDFKFFKAAAKSSSEIKFDADGQQVLELEFMIFPDTSTTPARFMIHGDPSIGLVAASAAAAVAGGGNVGGGTVGSISAGSATKTETITLTCVGKVAGAGNFKVVGSVTGIIGVAVVGVGFSSNSVNFTIADGSPDFEIGDSFTIATTAANYA